MKLNRENIIFHLGPLGETLMGHDFFNPIHLRFSAILDQKIDEALLCRAWERTVRIYPVLDAVLMLDDGDTSILSAPDAKEKYFYAPIYLVKGAEGKNLPVRSRVPLIPGTDVFGRRTVCVTFFDRSVTISAYHTVVDGGGLMMVFSTLVYLYLALATGQEDVHPPVELEEGRSLEEYFVPFIRRYLEGVAYTPTPPHVLPPFCKGFLDPEMRNTDGTVKVGSLRIRSSDFLRVCKANGANPSSLICALLARAAYALNPEEENDAVFGLTVSNRKILGLEKSIANVVGCAVAHVSRADMAGKLLSEICPAIRREVDIQRGRDYQLSFSRLSSTYRMTPDFAPLTVTYTGTINIGENNRHIVSFAMETNGDSNLYLMQVNDDFYLTLQYGLATEKYLKKFLEIFAEEGIHAEYDRPAQNALKDAPTAVL